MRSTHQRLGAPERSKKSQCDLNPTQNSCRLCISSMTLLKTAFARLKLESNKTCILRIMEREPMYNSGFRRAKNMGFGASPNLFRPKRGVRLLPRDSFNGMKEPSPSQASSEDSERSQHDVLYQPCVAPQRSRHRACLSILT